MTVELTRAYYIRGTPPQHTRFRYCISDPPAAGWQFVLVEDLGRDMCRLFCPYTLQSWIIPHDAGEIAKGQGYPLDSTKFINLIRKNWKAFYSLGTQCDYATAANVLGQLGGSPPDLSRVIQRVRPGVKPGEPAKLRSGGKPMIEDKLSPIKPKGRRADVTRYFLNGGSITACMAKLGLTRSGVLSHLYCINRDHGLGYELTGGDAARLVIPDGHEVFIEEAS